jgi:hypothetical protein
LAEKKNLKEIENLAETSPKKKKKKNGAKKNVDQA